MVHPSLFSSDTVEWETPQTLFDFFNKLVGGFALDAAATAQNTKCERFISQEQDALETPWTPGPVWCNPPYARGVTEAWVLRAWNQCQVQKVRVFMLLPSRTDTLWWHLYAMAGCSIYFVQGRLHFGGAKNSAPFPSVVLEFCPDHQHRVRVYSVWRGEDKYYNLSEMGESRAKREATQAEEDEQAYAAMIERSITPYKR